MAGNSGSGSGGVFVMQGSNMDNLVMRSDIGRLKLAESNPKDSVKSVESTRSARGISIFQSSEASIALPRDEELTYQYELHSVDPNRTSTTQKNSNEVIMTTPTDMTPSKVTKVSSRSAKKGRYILGGNASISNGIPSRIDDNDKSSNVMLKSTKGNVQSSSNKLGSSNTNTKASPKSAKDRKGSIPLTGIVSKLISYQSKEPRVNGTADMKPKEVSKKEKVKKTNDDKNSWIEKSGSFTFKTTLPETKPSLDPNGPQPQKRDQTVTSKQEVDMQQVTPETKKTETKIVTKTTERSIPEIKPVTTVIKQQEVKVVSKATESKTQEAKPEVNSTTVKAQEPVKRVSETKDNKQVVRRSSSSGEKSGAFVFKSTHSINTSQNVKEGTEHAEIRSYLEDSLSRRILRAKEQTDDAARQLNEDRDVAPGKGRPVSTSTVHTTSLQSLKEEGRGDKEQAEMAIKKDTIENSTKSIENVQMKVTSASNATRKITSSKEETKKVSDHNVAQSTTKPKGETRMSVSDTNMKVTTLSSQEVQKGEGDRKVSEDKRSEVNVKAGQTTEKVPRIQGSYVKNEQFKAQINMLVGQRPVESAVSAPSSLQRRKHKRLELVNVVGEESIEENAKAVETKPAPELHGNTFPRGMKSGMIVSSMPTSPIEEVRGTVKSGTVSSLVKDKFKNLNLTGRSMDAVTLERQRSRTSLTSDLESTTPSGTMNKKYKFVVEGIDVPAAEDSDCFSPVTPTPITPLTPMSPDGIPVPPPLPSDGELSPLTPHTLQRLKKEGGFSYILDEKLAGEIKKKAADVSAKKAHEALDQKTQESKHTEKKEQVELLEARAKLQKKDSTNEDQRARPLVKSSVLLEARSKLQKSDSPLRSSITQEEAAFPAEPKVVTQKEPATPPTQSFTTKSSREDKTVVLERSPKRESAILPHENIVEQGSVLQRNAQPPSPLNKDTQDDAMIIPETVPKREASRKPGVDDDTEVVPEKRSKKENKPLSQDNDDAVVIPERVTKREASRGARVEDYTDDVPEKSYKRQHGRQDNPEDNVLFVSPQRSAQPPPLIELQEASDDEEIVPEIVPKRKAQRSTKPAFYEITDENIYPPQNDEGVMRPAQGSSNKGYIERKKKKVPTATLR